MSFSLPTQNSLDTFVDDVNTKDCDTKFLWDNATLLDRENYQKCLDHNLQDINLPLSALRCHNYQCKLHYNDFIILQSDIIKAIEKSITTNLPSYKINSGKKKSSFRLE